MELHEILKEKHYNHCLPHFPSVNMISLKTEASDEYLRMINSRIEIYFYKMIGYKFIEEDEDFKIFWSTSVRILIFNFKLFYKDL